MEQEFITRRQIEAAIAQARAALEQIGWDADAAVARLADENVLPLRYHPVWGDEWRAVIAHERRQGVETGPPLEPEVSERWYTMARWEEEIYERGSAPGLSTPALEALAAEIEISEGRLEALQQSLRQDEEEGSLLARASALLAEVMPPQAQAQEHQQDQGMGY
jgi:hypothetical protein